MVVRGSLLARFVAVAGGLVLLAGAAPALAFTPDSWYTQGITASLTPPVVTWGAPASATGAGGSGGTAGGGTTSGAGTSTRTGAGAGAGAGTSTGTGTGAGAGTGGGTGTGTGTGSGGSGAGAGAVTLTGGALQVFNWTNQLRAQHGLPPLADNALLDHIALLKCQDMVNNNYFGDVSPTYGTALQTQQAFGVNARIMGGENLAGAATVAMAFWMLETSPPHLANLVYPGYTAMGNAVVPLGTSGVYVCQEFIGN